MSGGRFALKAPNRTTSDCTRENTTTSLNSRLAQMEGIDFHEGDDADHHFESQARRRERRGTQLHEGKSTFTPRTPRNGSVHVDDLLSHPNSPMCSSQNKPCELRCVLRETTKGGGGVTRAHPVYFPTDANPLSSSGGLMLLHFGSGCPGGDLRARL